MKPTDKAIEAALAAHREARRQEELSGQTTSQMWMQQILTAAYAAQFQSEDYAGLLSDLRIGWATKENNNRAADAIEALLAERDDFAEQLALRSESGMTKDLQEFLRKFREDDSAAIRMFSQYRDLEIEMDTWKSLWEKANAHIKQVEAERDALLARLAPVEDEALVEIVAVYCSPEMNWNEMSEKWKNSCRRDARAAIAAIRPHIEAAERERCAKVAEKYENEKANYLLDASSRAVATLWRMEIAAAIRSGK